ncbi:MAG: Fe-S cluster assembly protein SufD [Armatimonadetes bacterium]|nr:Fe-S cluster assembly protein SufD [Armatimonadota bacterium]
MQELREKSFVNGRYVADLSDLSDGVEAGSLKEAWARGLEAGVGQLGRVATLEGKLGSFNDDRFVHLNTARFEDGAYLFVPKSMEAAVQFVFLQANDDAVRAEVYPRVLIVLEENAIADVSECYIGLRGDCFVAPVTEVILAPHAALNHVRLQLESEGTYHVGTMAATQEHDSTYRSTTAAFGARTSRLDSFVWVGGEHAETSLNGVYVGEGEQVLDNHTRIDHAVPNCHSFEVYKGILKDKSQGVFNGKIFVYKDAQKTDAKQTNQALLLSRTAGVNTKPQLEIFADDVKCTHGATVGQLREEAMFYLRSRGIPESEARNILVYAFAAEVFEGIENEAARTELERLLFEKLN